MMKVVVRRRGGEGGAGGKRGAVARVLQMVR
jgi:hypothetical protein